MVNNFRNFQDTLTPLLPLLARLLEQESLTEGQAEVVRPLLARFTPVVAPDLTCNNLPLQLFTAAIKNEAKMAGGSSIQEMAVSQVCTCVDRAVAMKERAIGVREGWGVGGGRKGSNRQQV